MENVSVAQWFALAVVFLGAGLLRGFTGFGFAMVAVPFGALWLPPEVIVPVVFLLSVYISLFAVRAAVRVCDLSSLVWMMASTAIGTPIGLLAPLVMPLKLVYMAIGVIVLFSLVPLVASPDARRLPPGASVAAGFLAGIFNCIAAMSGPPVIYYFMRGPFTHAEARLADCLFLYNIDLLRCCNGLTGLLKWEGLPISLGAFP